MSTYTAIRNHLKGIRGYNLGPNAPPVKPSLDTTTLRVRCERANVGLLDGSTAESGKAISNANLSLYLISPIGYRAERNVPSLILQWPLTQSIRRSASAARIARNRRNCYSVIIVSRYVFAVHSIRRHRRPSTTFV